ncbi:MAG: putative Tetraacyldisaccharide 4-kinase [Pseudomonadota bacterium]
MSLQRAWLRRGALAWSLRPVSWIYGALAAAHRVLYRLGLRRARRLTVPVVVVGNVVAGGAGKTPVVIALVEHLKARGLRPGVISRGYGRRGEAAYREVRPEDIDAQLTGDEPLLIARRCRVPVVVGAHRAQAGQLLLARHPQVQVLVCDDGLQHPALARDLEVCVFDARGTGNGWLLPAGPLREPWPRHADLVLRPAAAGHIPGFDIGRRLAGEAVRADGTRRALADLAREPLAAVAGIAQPEAFFDMLRAAGLTPVHTCALADHHDFDTHPVGLPAGMACVCTEKDAVKLWRQRPDAWAVPLQVEIDPAFWVAFDRLLAAKLSSTDGSETA